MTVFRSSVNVPQLTDPERTTDSAGPQTGITFADGDSLLRKRRRGNLTYDKIKELRNDPTVSLCRQSVVSPAVHTAWTFKSNNKAPRGAKKFIEDMLMPHRLHFLHNSFNGSMDYGWQPFEIVYKLENGFIVLDNFKQLLQEYTDVLVYMDTGNFAGFQNWVWSRDEVTLFKIESQLVTWEVRGTYWYGRSVMEVIEDSRDSWTTVEEASGRYDKKISGGNWIVYFPVGETPLQGEQTPNDEIAETILKNLVASGGVAVPDTIQEFVSELNEDSKGKWRIELIESNPSNSANFIDRQKYLDNLCYRAFGFPERAIAEGKFGTKAEAETHSDIALGNVDTKHRLTVAWLNIGAINNILSLNYGPEARDTVWVEVAPLVDAQFKTEKEVYSRMIQNNDILRMEYESIDSKALRDSLSIPSSNGSPN